MKWVLQITGVAGQAPAPPDFGPYYVKMYDPDANEGRGSVTTTHQMGNALVFPTAKEGWDFWRRKSTVRPLRTDGHPNRPLTAFTVMVVRLKEGTNG